MEIHVERVELEPAIILEGLATRMIIIELKLQCRSAAPASVPARDDIAASKDLVRQGALPPGAALDVSLERHQILGRRVPVKARAGLDAIGIVIGGFHAVGASATLHIQPVVDRVVAPVSEAKGGVKQLAAAQRADLAPLAGPGMCTEEG